MSWRLPRQKAIAAIWRAQSSTPRAHGRTPNPLGASGLPALGEDEFADRIAYGIPDILGRDRPLYAGRKTLVVGSGHSAANALLELVQLAETEPAHFVFVGDAKQ